MTLAQLEAELAATAIGRDPDRWAVTAYRVALARSESATHPDTVDAALQLLHRSAGILTSSRAPVEHARILTATANCHRLLADHQQAVRLFEQACDLLSGRVSGPEQSAALTNLGLALVESGEPTAAIEPLTRAVALASGPLDREVADDDSMQRVLGAALVNRAQAHQAAADPASLALAIDDYRAATSRFDPEAPQRGMALHGLGSAILDVTAPGEGTVTVDDAIGAFQKSLKILTVDAFAFQHALAQHSLAIAYERRSSSLDLARALDCAEASLAVFDPRLHRNQWTVTADTLARLETRLGSVRDGKSTRIDHIVDLMVATDETERETILRARLRRLTDLPVERTRRDLSGLARTLTKLAVDEYQCVARSMIPVLMELPEPVLDAACAELCVAHRRSGTPAAFDAALDEVLHDLLHGPQRVRVRDILESYGWERP